MPFEYLFPLDRMLCRLKYDRRLAFGRVLGELVATAVRTRWNPPPDCLVPVPLHPRRLRERRFNQAAELARPIATALGIPLLETAVIRSRATPEQVGLSARERRQNLRDAFVAHGLSGIASVGLVDDVLTTGTTLAELARCVRAAGVTRISVCACARAAGPGRGK